MPLGVITTVRDVIDTSRSDHPRRRSRVEFSTLGRTWLLLLVTALNYHYMLGGAATKLRMLYGPLTATQQHSQQLLADEVHIFLEQNKGRMPQPDWSAEMASRGIGYDGSEVYAAETLEWARLREALPPAEACAAVEATAVACGAVRAALEHPELVLR